MGEAAAVGLGGFALLWVIMMLALGVFWLWMFVDVLSKHPEDKLVWALVVFFFSVPGALIYYFVARKKRISAAVA